MAGGGMDFIERWFGVSPDGGSGRLEITLIIVALVVLAAPFLIIKFGLRRSDPKYE
jgi:hypothetical protein